MLKKVKPIEVAVYDSNENFYFKNFLPSEKKNKGFLKTAHKVWYEYYKEYKLSLYEYADKKLNTLYNYIKKNKYDNLTFLMLGDHGTRFYDNKKYQKLLNPEINKIGFFLKDNNKSIKNKNISIIDIFPSLASKYNNKRKINLNHFDGVNSLFSMNEKNIILCESLYKTKFSLLAKYKNYLYFQNYKMDENKSISDKEKFFLDENMNEIRIKNQYTQKIFKKLEEHCSKHIKRNFKK